MSNQKHEELDMNELTELTPFSLDVYKTRGKIPSSKDITLKVLESAKPLQPWNNQRDKAQFI
jgi:hypothetical protein